jgi:hypothetical protein
MDPEAASEIEQRRELFKINPTHYLFTANSKHPLLCCHLIVILLLLSDYFD